MAQQPAKRHVIADIRMRCDLTQSELAKILGCAGVTVQRIEQGTLEMSEDLAWRVENALDVAASYLLANDLRQEPVTARGGHWSKDLYEFAQGARVTAVEKKLSGRNSYRLRIGPHPLEGATEEFTAWKVADCAAKIHAMIEGTKGTPRQGILLHRLNKFIKELTEDFQPDESTLAKHRPNIGKLFAAYDANAQRIAVEEQDRIWREEQEDLASP